MTKLSVGRPTTYSIDLADEICTRLSQGESLRSIVKDDHMPAQSTVYMWLLRDKEFAEHYARAREEQADTHADEIVAIADETPETVPVYDKDGNLLELRLDSAYIQWQKNRIDARKWTAMKLKPKKYGDKVTHANDEANPMSMQINLGVFTDILQSLKQERQLEIANKK